jgi:drug/metabolite transporter (DMT)-like permease
MRERNASTIRTLLRSGEITDIGGRAEAALAYGLTSDASSIIGSIPARPPAQKISHPSAPQTTLRVSLSSAAKVSRVRLVAAFAAVYLVWGSTYLGIRYAIETIPPLLMMGMRHLLAGGFLYAWVRWRGTPAPRLREWTYPAVIGALLFLGGHGSLAWAEQRVPSGIAALLVATLPIWIAVLARLWGTERHLSGRALAGLVLGFVGVAVLFGPDLLHHTAGLNLLGAGAVLFGTFIWAAGTIYMRSVKMPDSPVLSSAMQMLAGGASLLIAASLSGEVGGFHLFAVTTRSWLSQAYLIVFGSIIAFTAYSWLHMVAPASRVATYAYVNPVVAVLVGWALAAEPIGIFTVIAMVIILAGVGLVNAGHQQEHAEVRNEEDEKAAA